MTSAQERVDRALAWWSAAPVDLRPDREDVEVFARLDVRELSVLHRLLWNDVLSLGRYFADLIAVLAQKGAVLPEAIEPVEESVPRADGPTTDGTDRQGELAARFDALRSYIEERRAMGEPLDLLTEEWIARAVNAPLATINKLPSRIQRKHKGSLLELLGASPVAPGSAKRADRPVDLSVGFDRQPDYRAAHQPRHQARTQGADATVVDLAWPAAEADFACYRVFAGLSGRTPLLFEGREVGRTAETSLVDAVAMVEGRRHFAVWAYLGQDAESAQAAEPMLWARGVALQPVADLKVSVNGDDVFGKWSAGDGADRVEVYRLPGGHDVPAHVVPEGHLLPSVDSAASLRGFEDRDLSAGEYEYRFYVVATIEGQVLRSAPVSERRTVSVPVPVIDDLTVVEADDGTTLTVSWSPLHDNAAHVEIHLSGVELPPGIGARELDEDALERNGFTEQTRRDVSPILVDGRLQIVLDWPSDLDRVHITAISQLGARFRVGASRTQTTARPIGEVTIHERVDEQLLTFSWPSGAGFVTVRRRPSGALDDDAATWPEVAKARREDHQRFGGLRLPPLPAEGCRLFLAGVAFQGGQAVEGEGKVVDYPGLRRLTYSFSEEKATEGRFRKTEVSLGHWIRVHVNAQVDVPVCLVSNPKRLPLHQLDGRRHLDGRLQAAAGETVVLWRDLRKAPGLGFVRMFVDLPAAEQGRYAVLDPSVHELWWG